MPDAKNNIELRSEAVQDILSKVPHWMIRWGNVVFLLLIILLFCISWMIKYPDIIVAEVLVTTQIPPQKEFARTGGRLDTILVVDNEMVLANQSLAVIENSANYRDVLLLQDIIDTISIRNTFFSFPIDELPILFLGDIEADFAIFENNYIQYILNKELQPFSNEAMANKSTLQELTGRLQSLLSQKKLNQTELLFKEKELQRSKKLFDQGIIAAQEYEIKQLEYLQAERNYANFDLSISQIKESQSQSHKAAKGNEISRTKEERMLLKRVLQSYNQLKRSIKIWEYTYVLKAKIKGQVAFLNIWDKNQMVQAGELVFSILPADHSAYIAKLKLPAQNSGKIKEGQFANIKLENYPEVEFGMLRGQLTKISLFPNSEGFYLIDVALSEKLITSYNKDIAFKQEMRGIAEIITEDLRLLERFFYQFKNVFN